MEKKTKIILGVVAVLGIAYFTRDKWMPKDETENTSGFLGFGSKRKKVSSVASADKLYPTQANGKCLKGQVPVNNGSLGTFCKYSKSSVE